MCITALRGMDKNKKNGIKGGRERTGPLPSASTPCRALGGCHYVQGWGAGGRWGPGTAPRFFLTASHRQWKPGENGNAFFTHEK